MKLSHTIHKHAQNIFFTNLKKSCINEVVVSYFNIDVHRFLILQIISTNL